MQYWLRLTSADDVALPAFAAVRRAAAQLLLTAGCRPCSNRSISPDPQQ